MPDLHTLVLSSHFVRSLLWHDIVRQLRGLPEDQNSLDAVSLELLFHEDDQTGLSRAALSIFYQYDSDALTALGDESADNRRHITGSTEKDVADAQALVEKSRKRVYGMIWKRISKSCCSLNEIWFVGNRVEALEGRQLGPLECRDVRIYEEHGQVRIERHSLHV